MHIAQYAGKEPTPPVTQKVIADFEKASLGPIFAADYLGMCMSKVVFNAVVNTLCTMFEVQMGQFIEYEGVPKMAQQLFNEAYDACERAGDSSD